MDSKKIREYWKKREWENLKHYLEEEEEYSKRLNEIYAETVENIEKEIDAFYVKYATKEGITLAEAKKRVSKLDMDVYERKAKRYVKEKNFSKEANEEMRLYNLTMKVNRLELLKANIGLELIAGSNEVDKFMQGILKGRTMDELKRQAGILGKTVRNNKELAKSIVNASYHNATFSQRIWLYNDMMKAALDKMIKQALVQGKSAVELSKNIRKYYIGDERLKNGKSGAIFSAERLMRTELARVQVSAQEASFEENEFTQYMFIVNSGCCPICEAAAKKNDGIYNISDMMPGENAPPMHPFCRCSVAAYEDEEEYEAWIDYLDKGGTTEEWEKLKNKKNIQTGGKFITGGKAYKPYDKEDKKEVAASKAYKIISKRNDIKVIAENSGFSEKEIKQIKRHIFYNKHKTYNGYTTLYPDYDMAVAWNRIYKGKPLDRDILLLNHELLESMLEKMYNLTISEAHERATRKYDWATKVCEELGMDGEPYGLL